MKKQRDTVILAVRIKKDLLARVKQKVALKGVSRNSWVIKAILGGLRSHKRKEKGQQELMYFEDKKCLYGWFLEKP